MYHLSFILYVTVTIDEMYGFLINYEKQERSHNRNRLESRP